MTVRGTTLRVPNAVRRIRFRFLPPRDAMSTARTAGANNRLGAIRAVAVADARHSVIATKRYKIPAHRRDFDLVA